MAKRSPEEETRELLERIQQGKIKLAELHAMIDELEAKIALSLKAVEDSKEALERKNNPS